MTASLRHQRGQGLIEVVITFLIISGSVIALLRFQNSLAYSTSVTQQENTALILAMKQIETLRDFTTITDYQAIDSGSSVYTGTNATFTTTWTITPNTNPNYKTIDITVSWQDRYGSTKTMRLTTQVAGLDPMYSAAIM